MGKIIDCSYNTNRRVVVRWTVAIVLVLCLFTFKPVIIEKWETVILSKKITYDTLTDSRDGQKYKTIKIGKQTWMAENLNYRTDSGSWGYKNSTYNYNKDGRLYDWNTALTVCPAGWKLPDYADWYNLAATAGGNAGRKLKSKRGWYWNDYDDVNGNGTDIYGFSAMPSGARRDDGDFINAGYIGTWWMVTENGGDKAYSLHIFYDRTHAESHFFDKRYGLSVRCVADNP